MDKVGWDLVLTENKVLLRAGERELVGDDGENLVLEEIGHGRSSAEVWVKFKGAKTGKNLSLDGFVPKSILSKKLNYKSVTEMITSVTAQCPWVELKRKRRKEQNSDGKRIQEKTRRMEVGDADISVSYNMGSLSLPYKDNYLGRFKINILTLSATPPAILSRKINQEWVDILKRKIKARPNITATVFPVLVDTTEVTSKEEFKPEKLCSYKLYALGGNHLRVALTQLSKESYLNELRNIHIDLYCQLKDDEAIDIANIHNGMMASLKPSFEDCVLQARDFFVREKDKLAEKVSRMMSDIEMKEVPKESIGTIVSVASYNETNFSLVQTLFEQHRQKFGCFKAFPQVLLKELQGIEMGERSKYLELALQESLQEAVKKCRMDKKKAKLEKAMLTITATESMEACNRLFPNYVKGIDKFLDIEIKNSQIPQCYIDYCKDALESCIEDEREELSFYEPNISISIKIDNEDVSENQEVKKIVNYFEKKIMKEIIKRKSKIVNGIEKNDNTNANNDNIDSGILDFSVNSNDSTQPPLTDTSRDLFEY